MQDARRERDEAFQPLAPCRAVGPGGELVDNRQRELSQVDEVAQVALVAGDARRFGLLLLQLVDAQSKVGGEPVEATAPSRAALRARAAADDRRFDDELFPLPRRA